MSTAFSDPTPLTAIQYWYLKMADKIFDHHKRFYGLNDFGLAKSVFNQALDLDLKLPDDFSINDGLLRKMESDGDVDEVYLNVAKRKIPTIVQAVKERLTSFADGHTSQTSLEKNIYFLSKALTFNDLQRDLLCFFACMRKGRYQDLLKALYPDRETTYEDYLEALGFLLGVDVEVLRDELEEENTLLGMQFLQKNGGKLTADPHVIDEPLQLILRKNFLKIDDLLHEIIGEAPETNLDAEDFRYDGSDFDDMVKLIKSYVQKPKARRKTLAMAGPPGTGKTERAAVAGKILKIPVFLVGVSDKANNAGYSRKEPDREYRIRALVRSAFIVRRTGMRALLVFDEAEDILRDLNRAATNETGSKAFTNEFLESLGIPVAFISNRTDLFDPATLRRILPIYYINYMPLSARVKAIVKKSKNFLNIDLTPKEAEQIAERAEDLTIAIIDSCIQAVSEKDLIDKKDVLPVLHREILRALRGMNNGFLPAHIHFKGHLTDEFQTSLITASEDIGLLRGRFQAALKDQPKALARTDIVIIGPPGTGRRTIAQHLASVLEKRSKIISFDLETAVKIPDATHALDFERSVLDQTVLIFNEASKFLLLANGHPFMERVRSHPLPSFLIADSYKISDDDRLDYELLNDFTFPIRTGCLTQPQLQAACKYFLKTDLTKRQLSGVDDLTIGEVLKIRRQFLALGGKLTPADLIQSLKNLRNFTQAPGKTGMNLVP